ncbi:hypothetical protein RhiirA4_480296 [Rhizophagus irregularis]|uniref:Helitron helicase-like domain-containing protein n=1 Tax=Rhizophagus irregularis TaxID=588596 RepID=A0A2I1HHQ2_9GLOM|nr:hypothetical protein RhiirA4_480296 [Rhizophagus irregularis]
MPSGHEESESIESRRKRLARERQVSLRERRKINDENRHPDHTEQEINDRTNELERTDNGITRHELGRMNQTCIHYGAKFWMEEKNRNSSLASPAFSICCAHGKVCLAPLIVLPPYLLNLYTSSDSDAVSFRKNIRRYNNVLVCTSFGADINVIAGQGISDFRIHSQVYHRIGSLLPEDGLQPAFAQLYIYDTEHENANRHNVMPDLNNGILHNLLIMLDECNPYIRNFRRVRDLIQMNVPDEIFMVIHADRTRDS